MNHTLPSPAIRLLPRLLVSTALVVALLGAAACSELSTSWPSANERALWDSALVPILESQPWVTSEGYAPSRLLVVPLHAAFLSGESDWQDAFHSMFEEFVGEHENRPDAGLSPEFLYLCTEYLLLASDSPDRTRASARLAAIVTSETTSSWNEAVQDIEEKVVARRIRPQYVRGITDEELLLIASASNLVAMQRDAGMDVSEELLEATSVAVRVLDEFGEFSETGEWDFQTGIWDRHPGYRAALEHARRLSLPEGAPPPRVSITMAQAQTLVLMLTSLQRALDEGSEQELQVAHARIGLEQRVFGLAMLRPGPSAPGWRLATFADGIDGSFFHADALHDRRATYPAAGLSGNFNLGWWAMLGTERIARTYWDQAARFPLPDSLVDTYAPVEFDGHTSLLTPPRWVYERGVAELIVRLAARISTERS